MIQQFHVEGMHCASCSASVEKAVGKLPGVKKAEVNLLAKTLRCDYDSKKTLPEDILETIADLGFVGSNPDTTFEDERKQLEALRSQRIYLLLSVVLLILLMIIAMGHMVGLPLPGWLEEPIVSASIQLLLTLPILFLHRHFFTNGIKALLRKDPTMDSLIAIGSLAAMVYGVFSMIQIVLGMLSQDHALVHAYASNLYFESAATIVTLVSVGKYLEERSKNRTGDAIKALLALAPKTAIILREGNEEEISVSDIRVGDVLVIRPGERIPVDGIVVFGQTSVDESALTGESIPVLKVNGMSVLSASLNQNGLFHMEATQVGDETTLAKIIALVKDASASKAPIARIADRVSGIFVPIVIALALLVTILWVVFTGDFALAFNMGISVLVISCPCALGLATPVSIMVSTGVSARNGVLLRTAEAFETLSKANVIILDKTGTITVGKPEVTDVIPFEIEQDTLLSIAYSLESGSEHPLASAILRYAEGSAKITMEFYESLVGLGIHAKNETHDYYAGNEAYFQNLMIDISPLREQCATLAQQGKTVMYFGYDHKLIGIFAVSDTIRDTSKQAISNFRKEGLYTVMLTGDRLSTARAIASLVEVDDVVAEVLPDGKAAIVERYKKEGKIVVMVGDGINDSPSLVLADVGIAVGTGTDIAIDSADIVLMGADLHGVSKAIRYSHLTLRNIKQNLFWAFLYNLICIPIAAGVLYPAYGISLNPMIASAAMSVSSLFVVLNALRLYRMDSLDRKAIDR